MPTWIQRTKRQHKMQSFVYFSSKWRKERAKTMALEIESTQKHIFMYSLVQGQLLFICTYFEIGVDTDKNLLLQNTH